MKNILITLKDDTLYDLKGVTEYSDPTWGPNWFHFTSEDGSERWIAASEIRDILITDPEVTKVIIKEANNE